MVNKPLFCVCVLCVVFGASAGLTVPDMVAWLGDENRIAENKRRVELDRMVSMIAPAPGCPSIVYALDNRHPVETKFDGGSNRFELWTNDLGFVADGESSRLIGVVTPWQKLLTQKNSEPAVWAKYVNFFEDAIRACAACTTFHADRKISEAMQPVPPET